jgi:enoyl-CoA hydratase
MELMEKGAKVALRLHEWPKPRVMAVTGHALAMGAVLLGCADLRIGAVGDFKIGFNEVGIGMPMPEFANELHRGRLSPRHFHQAIALARIYGPVEAVEAGFLDRVADADEVVDVAVGTAAELATRLNQSAFAITRATMDRDLTARLHDLTTGWVDEA